METVKSPKLYPRQDNVYKSKSSMNFDAIRAKIYEDLREDRNHG